MPSTDLPIRICLLTNTFSPEIGAAPSRLADMVKGLTAAKFEVLVITAMPHYPQNRIFPPYRRRWTIEEKIHEATVIRHWVWASHSRAWLPRLLNMASAALTARLFSYRRIKAFDPHFIMAQMPPLGMPLLASWIAKKLNAHFILNVSDIWPSALGDLAVTNQNSWLFKRLSHIADRIYSASDMVMAQSQETLDWLHERFPQKAMILYRTGADSRLFTPKQDYSPSGRSLRLVYTGIFGMAHGLLKLCQQIDFAAIGVELHLYGDGLERKALDKYCERFPGRGIYVHPPVPAEDVPMIVLAHDAVLISQTAYVRGTLPSKLYEAMFAAMPIIYHGAGEGAKIIQSSKAGLVSAPQDYATLKKNIKQLVSFGLDGRLFLGRNGRKIAEKQFERQDQIKHLITILQTASKPISHAETKYQ